jgi:hypothetical protein
MREQNARPDPKETVEIIDALIAQGFDDAEFRTLHHFGGSLTRFRTYGTERQSFRQGGTNHKLAIKLRKRLDSC